MPPPELSLIAAVVFFAAVLILSALCVAKSATIADARASAKVAFENAAFWRLQADWRQKRLEELGARLANAYEIRDGVLTPVPGVMLGRFERVQP